VLGQFEAVRVVTPVLLGDVVPALALLASHRDLRPDIGRLRHDLLLFIDREIPASVVFSCGTVVLQRS